MEKLNLKPLPLPEDKEFYWVLFKSFSREEICEEVDFEKVKFYSELLGLSNKIGQI